MREFFEGIVWLWPWIWEDFGGIIISFLVTACLVGLLSFALLAKGEWKPS